jgi:hypothetical protein
MPLQEVKLKAKSDAPSKSGLENVEPDVLEKAMDDAMRKEGSELDLSEEEQKNFKKAFQDKEFRKMMAEYVDEISDPKHRAEQDAYIREMEAKGETPKDKKSGPSECGLRREDEEGEGRVQAIPQYRVFRGSGPAHLY